MGRPLNKRLFGANSSNNIKVQFNNGTESVPGYIVKQKSNLQFLCADADGNRAVCKLVNTSSANLAVGEMSITVKYDNNDIQQVVKISKNLITVATDELGGSSTGYRQQGWTFSSSTTDQKWQIEEVGTNTNLTYESGALDLEGDDLYIPTGMDRNAPLPGSGSLFTTATSGLVAYSLKGTPYDPGSSTSTVANSTAGLYRKKYVGEAMTAAGNTATWNMNFFTTGTSISTTDHEVDTYVSFGQRGDLPFEDGYSFEWKGYIYADTTATYNTAITCDDDVIMWIGDGALNPSKTNAHHAQAYNTQGVVGYNPNGVTLTGGMYYPVRLWFVEYGGDERFQLFMNRNAGSAFLGGTGTTAITFAHNSVTKGY